LEGLSSGGFQLSDPVGLGAANNPNDVFQVESALSGADSPAQRAMNKLIAGNGNRDFI